MLDPTKRDGLEPSDVRFLEIIEKYGWHVMSVAPRTDSDDKQEWFSYSTGLFRALSHPEIIVCGLDASIAQGIVNEIAYAIKKGRAFELDTDYSDIFANDVKCRFRPVHLRQYGEYVCWSQWFYEGNDFPVWQCFWPDKQGKYPWEPDCNSEVSVLQPLLYLRSHKVT